ncbi:hypothetical protein WJX72_010642 [[Myrmecia] bisecta]|uniref:Uncharacterized protein n=1 Tax=[Myrmecia] bisecta TaxID=41462 RepID=A0AAW1PEP1_9CHLO
MGLLSALGNLVRCRCRQVWGDGQDPYRAPADDQQVASPASIKISTDNEHQIEVKIKYNVNSRLKEQLYQLDLFMFFPEELEAVHTDFYEDLWQIVRLHTPKVALSSLASGHGVSTAIAAKVQEVRLKTKAGEECREPADTLVQQLRLHTCVFRSANRKATRQAVHCLKKLKAAMDAGESIRENQRLVARLLHDLVAHSCGAIQDLQRICQPCLEPDMPELVRQGWALADEFMLCEAKRAFMKLLRDIDKLDMFKASTVLQAEAATDHASLVLPLQQEESDSPVLSDLPPATPFAGARPVSLPASALSQPQPRSTADNAADQPPRDLEGSEQAGPGPSSESLLHHAHDLVSMAIYALRAESERRGYVDSIIHEDDPHQNEAYTNRIKVLKHNARAVVSMSHQVRKPSTLLVDVVRKPSTLLVDVVGMTIAGMAMCLAVLAIWLASRLDGRGQFGPVYVTIIVVGYMLKDRMKEWGKRYLQPVASWFGFKFPDRIVHVVDQRGVRVGRCAETSKIVSDGAVPERVLLMRHHGTASPLRQATKPERVMTYHKEMKVRWDKLDPRLEGVTGLDDVMRIDLGRFCRRMQPGMEPHFRLQTTPDGRMHVSKG